MATNLMRRVKRLVAASVTNLVEAVENATPETVLREAVREVESAIGQVRDELGRVLAEQHLARTRLANAGAKHEELSEQIQIAIAEGRDDLAKAAIARQLDVEAQTLILEEAMRDASAEAAELETYLAALAARKREMEDELDAFLSSRSVNESTDANAPEASLDSAERAAARAENAFHQILRTHASTSGPGTGDRATETKLAELEKLARDNRVEERLTALKADSGGDV